MRGATETSGTAQRDRSAPAKPWLCPVLLAVRYARKPRSVGRRRAKPWLCSVLPAVSFLLTFGVTGCSMQKIAASSMVPIVEDSLIEAYASADIETVREALPSQLLLLRGVCQSDLEKTELWTPAVQLYASYALIFVEAEDPDRAARLYDEGMDLGLRFLKRRSWIRTAWDKGPDALREEIGRRQPRDLAPIMMWTAACLGKHVLNNLDRPREVADLPYVYVLSDAAIELEGDYYYGMPHVLKGIMLSLTPPMLGGDKEEADRLFQTAFEITQRRFLYHHVLYANYYCVPMLDEDLFQEILREVLDAPEGLLPEARLIGLLARERAQRLLDAREDLF